jgi:hypothetical protein
MKLKSVALPRTLQERRVRGKTFNVENVDGIPVLLMSETVHGLKVDLAGDSIRVYDLNA